MIFLFNKKKKTAQKTKVPMGIIFVKDTLGFLRHTMPRQVYFLGRIWTSVHQFSWMDDQPSTCISLHNLGPSSPLVCIITTLLNTNVSLSYFYCSPLTCWFLALQNMQFTLFLFGMNRYCFTSIIILHIVHISAKFMSKHLELFNKSAIYFHQSPDQP